MSEYFLIFPYSIFCYLQYYECMTLYTYYVFSNFNNWLENLCNHYSNNQWRIYGGFWVHVFVLFSYLSTVCIVSYYIYFFDFFIPFGYFYMFPYLFHKLFYYIKSIINSILFSLVFSSLSLGFYTCFCYHSVLPS